MELVSFTPTNICSPDSSHLPPAREEHREAHLTSASYQGGTQGSTAHICPLPGRNAGKHSSV